MSINQVSHSSLQATNQVFYDETVLLFKGGQTMRSRKSPLGYIILNILVSAATTLLVLVIWNQFHKVDLPKPTASLEGYNLLSTQIQPTLAACPAELESLPPLDQAVIQIQNIIGSGDLQNEVIELKRVGSGNLCLTDWALKDEDGNTFTFPNLVLNSEATIDVYTRTGRNSVTELYWGLQSPAWKPGETATLVDSGGNVRAVFVIP
jgi:hypothetical protein